MFTKYKLCRTSALSVATILFGVASVAQYVRAESAQPKYSADVPSYITTPDSVKTRIGTLKFKNGALGMVDNSRQAVYGYDQRVEVFGSKGALIAENDMPNTVKLYTDECTSTDKIPYFFLERYNDSYITEMKEFIRCLKENREPPVGGVDGLNAVLIAIAAKKSLDENRPVKIREIE